MTWLACHRSQVAGISPLTLRSCSNFYQEWHLIPILLCPCILSNVYCLIVWQRYMNKFIINSSLYWPVLFFFIMIYFCFRLMYLLQSIYFVKTIKQTPGLEEMRMMRMPCEQEVYLITIRIAVLCILELSFSERWLFWVHYKIRIRIWL